DDAAVAGAAGRTARGPRLVAGARAADPAAEGGAINRRLGYGILTHHDCAGAPPGDASSRGTMAMVLADPLPEDLDALRGWLRSVVAERDAALAERELLAEQNDRLRHLLRQLQRRQFGRRSEKLDPDQLQLALEDLEQVVEHRP